MSWLCFPKFLTSALLLIPRTMALVPQNRACMSLACAFHCGGLRLLLECVHTYLQLCSDCEYLAIDQQMCPQAICPYISATCACTRQEISNRTHKLSVHTYLQWCCVCEYLARDQKLCPQGVSEDLSMFCQVAQAALQVWANGSRTAEVLLDTLVQERIDLEAALKDVLLPHLSKMSAEAFQVRLLSCQHKRVSLVLF